jgi:hypothetical protein
VNDSGGRQPQSSNGIGVLELCITELSGNPASTRRQRARRLDLRLVK